MPDELWNEVHDIGQETGIKTIPMEKKCKKAKWLPGEALQIAVKSKGEKERYKHLNAEFIMRNAGLEETQAGIKNARRNLSNLRYADDTTLMAESEEELKSLLMKVKVESEKVGWLKAQHSENEDHGIWSHHFMGNRWGNSGNSVRLSFLGLQNHCRW